MVFSREFFHPADHLQGASPEAVDRFFADSRRFPVPAYEEANLVWRQSEWRVPSPSERSMMMGAPSSATAAVQDREPRRTQIRNSLIGNGFHIPCIFMCMLVHLCEAKPVLCRFSPHDELAERLQHTLWQPGFLESFLGLLDSDGVVDLLRFQFRTLPVKEHVWAEVSRNLKQCNLGLPQAFTAFQRGRGQPWCNLPPLPMRARDRAQIFAGNTGQRYASDTSKGLDHLLPPGLGKEQHISQAKLLQSPFAAKPWPEDDIAFLAESFRVWGRDLPLLARKQREVIKSLCRAVEPLRSTLESHRCVSSKRVAGSKNPAFIALLTALMRWPDLGQAQAFVEGFPIVGHVAPSGVFRNIAESASEKEALDAWLSREEQSVVDELLQRGPPRDHDVIYQVTMDEITKGFCSELMTRSEVDHRFGCGRWRALERFVITQPDGKQRVIDNARRTGHNDHTMMLETIHTVSVDFVASCARDIFHAIFRDVDSAAPPECEWLRMRLGTDDLPDAYRGHPVADSHLAYSVVAIWVPGKGRMFTVLWGLAYGLEAAVVAFNRLPLLGIAACRRLVSSCAEGC